MTKMMIMMVSTERQVEGQMLISYIRTEIQSGIWENINTSLFT